MILLAASAGCARQSPNQQLETTAEAPSVQKTPRLGDIWFANNHSEPHSVEVEVIQNDTTLSHETYNISADTEQSDVIRHIDTLNTTGNFTIRARFTNTSEWKALNTSSPRIAGGGCFAVALKVTPSGTLELSPAGQSCELDFPKQETTSSSTDLFPAPLTQL